MRTAHLFSGLAIALAIGAGCESLHSLHSDHTGQHGHAPSPPNATFAPLTLTFGPTRSALAAHFCPVLAEETPLSADANAACRAYGNAPTHDSLQTHVRVEATATSSNMVRLRVESLLLVLTIYPDGAPQTVGAACLTFCDEGASACPQTDEACHSTDTHVVDLGDVSPTRGFLVSTAAEEQRVADLRVQELAPHGTLALSVDLAVGTDALMDAIHANDATAMSAIRAGTTPTFSIPYALEGTFWVDGRGNDGFAESITRATGTIEFPAE